MSEAPKSGATYDLRPKSARWTHIALRVADIDESIDWYTTFTPLQLLEKRSDDEGFGAWLGQPEPTENPFVLVLAQFLPGHDPFAPTPIASIGVFNHIGIELPDKADVDAIAQLGAEAGCLGMAPKEMGVPIGYICMLTDPDGNWVEFSYDQGVYEKAREVWGDAAAQR